MEAVRKVTDRFDMCDYFNASDLTITNSQIAKYIIENPELIHKNSLNALSGMSFFQSLHYQGFLLESAGYLLGNIFGMILSESMSIRN